MDINYLKNSINNLAENNIVRIISDIIFPNLDKVDNFSETESYQKKDIVYRFNSITNKHNLCVCNKDYLEAGSFNEIDWDIYNFKLDRTPILEDTFTSPSNGTTSFEITNPLFDYQKDYVVLYHSVRGRLAKDTDWVLNNDHKTIQIVGFTLYLNEKILIEIHK